LSSQATTSNLMSRNPVGVAFLPLLLEIPARAD
jgi:hypothetical protein